MCRSEDTGNVGLQSASAVDSRKSAVPSWPASMELQAVVGARISWAGWRVELARGKVVAIHKS
jgi:hypothetical protein